MSNPLLDDNTAMTIEAMRDRLLLLIGAFSVPNPSWDRTPLDTKALRRLRLELDTLSVLIDMHLKGQGSAPPEDFAEDFTARLCGDYPAPCNCDNPLIHDGHNNQKDTP